jgi:hypothetical protein
VAATSNPLGKPPGDNAHHDPCEDALDQTRPLLILLISNVSGVSKFRGAQQPRPLPTAMKTTHPLTSSAAVGFLVDELRSARPATYAAAASAPQCARHSHPRGRWRGHDLRLLMRRNRRAHPTAAVNFGAKLYAHRARRVIRSLKRRGLNRPALVAGALNAKRAHDPRLARPGRHGASHAFDRSVRVLKHQAAGLLSERLNARRILQNLP